MRNSFLICICCLGGLLLSIGDAAAERLAPPHNLQAAKSAKLEGAVELSWSVVRGATGYLISASRENDDNWHNVGESTVTEFQVNELPEETKYYFRVASVGKSGQSDWSKAVVQVSSGKRGPHLAGRRLATVAEACAAVTRSWRSPPCLNKGRRAYLLPPVRVR
jgi:predicted phage tail protein